MGKEKRIFGYENIGFYRIIEKTNEAFFGPPFLGGKAYLPIGRGWELDLVFLWSEVFVRLAFGRYTHYHHT